MKLSRHDRQVRAGPVSLRDTSLQSHLSRQCHQVGFAYWRKQLKTIKAGYKAGQTEIGAEDGLVLWGAIGRAAASD